MSELTPVAAGDNPWGSYMVQLYGSRSPPQPLGTVAFDEIEAKAKEKLKDCGGRHNLEWNVYCPLTFCLG